MIETFEELGFALVTDSRIGDLVNRLHDALKPVALTIIERDPVLGGRMSEVQPLSFREIFDWVIRNEESNSVSRAFYELFPALAEVISITADPLCLDLARSLGVGRPVPSTLPILRIDRPGDTRFRTADHQDFWFSMLSENSITYWIPILPVTADMGLLQVIPGSHKAGLVAFRSSGRETPFGPGDGVDENGYVDVHVGDNQLLAFSQLLMHRSGQNRSSKARLTMQVRYNDLETRETMTTSFTPASSRRTHALQEEVLSQGTLAARVSHAAR